MKLLIVLCFSFQCISAGSPFVVACAHDRVNEVKALLDDDKDLLIKKDKNDFFPIHHAAFNGSCKVLSLLLDAKPDLVDACDGCGNIPFIQLFLGIYDWREKAKANKLIREILAMGLIKGPWPVDDDVERLASYKGAIGLFIARKANLDIPNNCNRRWTEIPGLDQELSQYAQSILPK